MHSIRLRQPWQFEIEADRVVWSRNFNWPPDNDDVVAIHLVVEPWPADACASLNAQELAHTEAAGRFLVTSLVRGSNNLQVSLPAPDYPQPEFPLDVRLEIEEEPQP